MELTEITKIPEHVAIIMDGNGRWAQSKGHPRVFGHQTGADRVREVVEIAGEMGVSVLTLYAFSEENWSRPSDEVDALLGLLATYLRKEVHQLCKNNIRLRAIGNLARLPSECGQLLREAEEKTKDNDGLQLVLALSYGGRSDITATCQKIGSLVAQNKLSPEDIDQELIGNLLSTSGMPDPDLLIRTSGEQRISNFLLWQIAYAELYFTPVNWPEFTKVEFKAAIEAFQSRQRRFGQVLDEQHKAPPELQIAKTYEGHIC